MVAAARAALTGETMSLVEPWMSFEKRVTSAPRPHLPGEVQEMSHSLIVSALVLTLPLAAYADDSVSLKGHKKDVDTVAVSADGKLVATGGDDGSVLIWDAGKVAATRESDSAIESVAFSPNGKLVAVGNMYGQVSLWDRSTNKDVFSAKGHEGRVVRIAFLPDGKTFITASWDQSLKVWDAATGKERATLSGPKYKTYGLALGADGKSLFSCDSNGGVTSWNTKTNKVGTTYAAGKGECHALALSSDGKTLAAGYGDGTIVFIDPKTGKEQRTAKVSDSVNSIAFSSSGTLAAGTQSEELQLVDGGGKVSALKGHGRPITAVVFSPDGKQLISGSMDMTVRVWTVK